MECRNVYRLVNNVRLCCASRTDRTSNADGSFDCHQTRCALVVSIASKQRERQFFLPRDAMHSAVLRSVANSTARRVRQCVPSFSHRKSVRLSVCHTRVLCPHGLTYDHDFWTIWQPRDPTMIFSPNSNGMTFKFKVKYKWGIAMWFSALKQLVRWPWRYFKVIRLFRIKFLVNGAW